MLCWKYLYWNFFYYLNLFYNGYWHLFYLLDFDNLFDFYDLFYLFNDLHIPDYLYRDFLDNFDLDYFLYDFLDSHRDLDYPLDFYDFEYLNLHLSNDLDWDFDPDLSNHFDNPFFDHLYCYVLYLFHRNFLDHFDLYMLCDSCLSNRRNLNLSDDFDSYVPLNNDLYKLLYLDYGFHLDYLLDFDNPFDFYDLFYLFNDLHIPDYLYRDFLDNFDLDYFLYDFLDSHRDLDYPLDFYDFEYLNLHLSNDLDWDFDPDLSNHFDNPFFDHLYCYVLYLFHRNFLDHFDLYMLCDSCLSNRRNLNLSDDFDRRNVDLLSWNLYYFLHSNNPISIMIYHIFSIISN